MPFHLAEHTVERPFLACGVANHAQESAVRHEKAEESAMEDEKELEGAVRVGRGR